MKDQLDIINEGNLYSRIDKYSEKKEIIGNRTLHIRVTNI
jgi:hypothetical protein